MTQNTTNIPYNRRKISRMLPRIGPKKTQKIRKIGCNYTAVISVCLFMHVVTPLEDNSELPIAIWSHWHVQGHHQSHRSTQSIRHFLLYCFDAVTSSAPSNSFNIRQAHWSRIGQPIGPSSRWVVSARRKSELKNAQKRRCSYQFRLIWNCSMKVNRDYVFFVIEWREDISIIFFLSFSDINMAVPR